MARRRHVHLKNPIRERYLFRNRAIVAAIGTLLLLLILLARLATLQILNHDHYTTLSLNNRVDIVPIAPTRGLIYDRNGVLLAENIPTYSLDIVPERVIDMNATLTLLQGLVEINEIDLQRFQQEVKRRRRFEQVPLRFRLSDRDVAQIAVNRYRLPGVEINSRLTRHYPHGELTTHIVGYMGRINEPELKQLDATNDSANYSATSHIGKLGIEKSYEPLLHGKVGHQRVETNALGRILRVIDRTPPTPGNNLYLNLDIRLQRAATEGFGDERGALVAIDPNTGAILTFVSAPSYNPNLFVNGIDYASYNALTRSADKPLINRALRGQYPPGSTIKPFIGLAGLESQTITTADSLPCPGFYQLDNDEHKYRDWKKGGHGTIGLTRAIVESCDIFFYDLGRQLGIDRISDYLNAFGFGTRTGIDVDGEAGGLLPSREWKRRAKRQPWYPGETLITSIGQGFFLTTPLQLASSIATLSLRGERRQPLAVMAMEDPISGERIELHSQYRPPVEVRDPEQWNRIFHAMTQVVHGISGTARGLNRKRLAYQVAGKTGTAQVFSIKQDEEYNEEDITKRLRDHALFVAFAPVNKPRIAIALIVENGGSGGAVAGPIARRVMDRYLLDDNGRLIP